MVANLDKLVEDYTPLKLDSKNKSFNEKIIKILEEYTQDIVDSLKNKY